MYCFSLQLYQIPGLANTLGNNALANSMLMGQGQLDSLKSSSNQLSGNGGNGQQAQNLLNPLLPLLGSAQFGPNIQQLQAQLLLNNPVSLIDLFITNRN